MFKPIHTEQDYEEALEAVSALVDLDPPKGSPEGDHLEVLATLVEAYERELAPMNLAEPKVNAAERLHQFELAQVHLSKAQVMALARQEARQNRIKKMGNQFFVLTGSKANLLEIYSRNTPDEHLHRSPLGRTISGLMAAKAVMRGVSTGSTNLIPRKVFKLTAHRKNKLVSVPE